MNSSSNTLLLSRRKLLRLGGQTAALGLLAGAGLTSATMRTAPLAAAPVVERIAAPTAQLPRQDIRLVATDGYFSLPGRRRIDGNGIFGFGFRGVRPDESTATPEVLSKYKGFVQWPAPILAVPKDIDLYVTMTNLGLVVRPDLDDSHTIHWHGFRNPNAVFDGVPEVSVSVPVSRDFAYFYRPRNEGTYMYHCHFEDTEHVQMGMDGMVYIEANNGRTYDNDANRTGYDRIFSLLLNEVDTVPHDGLADVQEFIWSNYNPNFFLINGRSYPDTVIRDQDLAAAIGGDFNLPAPGLAPDPDLGFSQPVSSLIQVNAGETALLRIANLGYRQHVMQLLGPRLTVVGHDATYLGANQYETSSIFLGPGESRDALFTAPAYSATIAGGSDGAGNYNRYWLRNRNLRYLTNGDTPGLGGMVTEVRVYPAGTLAAQPGPNQTL